MAKSRRQREERDKRQRDEFDAPSSESMRPYKTPSDLKAFKFEKAGTTLLAVYPYKAGKNNPYRDKGALAPARNLLQHRDVGPEGKTVCCPKMFDPEAPCPICAHRQRIWRDTGDPDKAKAFNQQKRVVMVVQDLNDKEAGLQLLDSSYYKGVGEAIATAKAEDPDKYESWWDPDQGYTLKVTTKKSKGVDGKPWYEPVLAEFLPRKKPLDKKLLKSVPCLDDLFKEVEFDDLKKMFLGGKSDDEEPEDEDETDTEDEEEDDDGESENEDEGADDDEEDEEGDESEEDDDEEDEEGDEDEDEGEDDEEEDEAPGVGDKIGFKHKGKKKEGTVEKTAKKGKMLQVKVKGEKGLVALEADDETIKVLERAEEEDDEELDDDSEIEDDEESEDEEESDDDDDEDSDDEDDDDEDDEE